MLKKSFIFISVIFLLILSNTVSISACPKCINSIADLGRYSTHLTNEYTIKSGKFVMKGLSPINISSSDFTISNRTTLTINAKKLDSNASELFKVLSLNMDNKAGMIIAIADNGKAITANSLIFNDGTIKVSGGTSTDSYGIQVTPDYTQTTPTSPAAYAQPSYEQYGGTLITTGGSGENSHGVHVSGPFTMGQSQITSDSKIIATGGSGDNAYGMYVFDHFAQYSGTIVAIGGSGQSAYGMYFDRDTIFTDSFFQHGGDIIAIGGTGTNAIGMYLNRKAWIQQMAVDGIMNPTITAIGGIGEDAYGLYLYSQSHMILLRNTITIDRKGSAASIFVDYTSYFSISSISYVSVTNFVVNVDLAKTEDLASGLLISNVPVLITYDTILSPKLFNTYSLAKGDSFSTVFIKTALNNQLNNSFIPQLTTITMEYDASINTNKNEYILTTTRLKTPKEALLGHIDDELIQVIDSVYNTLADPAIKPGMGLSKFLDAIDNSTVEADAGRIISDAVEYAHYLQGLSRSIKTSFINNYIGMTNKLDLIPLGKNNYFWAEVPLVIFSDEYINNTPLLGVTLGFEVNLGNFNIAIQGQFAGGKMHERTTGSLPSIGFIRVGASTLFDYLIPTQSDVWKPHIGLDIQYDRSFMGNLVQNAFRAAIKFSNEFGLSKFLSIKPIIGLDFVPMTYSAYNPSYNPDVRTVYTKDNPIYIIDMPVTYSLLANILLNLKFNINTNLHINALGYVNYELLKQDFHSVVARGGDFLALNYINEPSRLSWGAGVDISYTGFGNGIGLVLCYNLQSHKQYINNQIKIGVTSSF